MPTGAFTFHRFRLNRPPLAGYRLRQHARIEEARLLVQFRDYDMTIGYYTLPGMRGRQGNLEYYLIQCPARLLPRLFLFNEAEVPAVLRRGRVLDPSRIAELAAYLSSNQESYTVAPLLAVVDCEVGFEPLTEDLPELGRLRIPMTARLIICDGQHRRAAIQKLLDKNIPIGNDTIPIMLIPDPNLDHSAHLYAMFNRYQIQTTLSKRVLHDHSDLAILTRQLVDEVPIFQDRTEFEKTTISNRSTALFTISAVYQATEALLGINKKTEVSIEQIAIAQQFWQDLSGIIPEWQRVINKEVTSAYLRQNYVHSHTVTLLAIGMTGHDLIEAHPQNWRERLRDLRNLDWSKRNTDLWEGRAMVHGKMSKSHDSVRLTAIAIKRALDLQLAEQEQDLENRLLGL